uniref:Uncharacterized protein n=1 Tax=Candidatus Kentrum sp. DK TaxID=2126562 RepID=A0A450TQ24_9GAMM|nr:MAG: hypothetical protein BECKDK2373C_GA0170839_12401 [Candidatus Kentron sp. DK]
MKGLPTVLMKVLLVSGSFLFSSIGIGGEISKDQKESRELISTQLPSGVYYIRSRVGSLGGIHEDLSSKRDPWAEMEAMIEKKEEAKRKAAAAVKSSGQSNQAPSGSGEGESASSNAKSPEPEEPTTDLSTGTTAIAAETSSPETNLDGSSPTANAPFQAGESSGSDVTEAKVTEEDRHEYQKVYIDVEVPDPSVCDVRIPKLSGPSGPVEYKQGHYLAVGQKYEVEVKCEGYKARNKVIRPDGNTERYSVKP